MNKKLSKQNFNRCETCGKSILIKASRVHICKFRYFNYRLNFSITASTNEAIRKKFNINDNNVITDKIAKEINTFRHTIPITNSVNINKFRLPKNQILSLKSIDELFHQKEFSELISAEDYSANNKYGGNNHRIHFNDTFYDSYFTKTQILHLANGVG